MPGEPHLRSVPPPEASGEPAGPAPRGSRLVLALTVALAIALALLVWNRMQLAQQVVDLRGQVQQLQQKVEARDRVIRAQQERLSDVRARVEGLREALDQPLPEAE